MKISNPIIAFLLFFQCQNSFTQQSAPFTQYMLNPVPFNAAYVGTLEGFSFTGAYRSQWNGIEDAPSTLYFVAEQRLNDRVGIGLTAINDDFGPTTHTDIAAHFSYGISFSERLKMRFSATATGAFFSLDTDEFSIADSQEVLFNDTNNSVSPNVGVGFLLHTDQWFLGFSAPRLWNTEDNEIAENFRVQNALFTAIGGYRINLDQDWAVRPSFLIQKETENPLLYNLTGTVSYKNRFTAGVNYRNSDAISALFSIWISEHIGIGYSYDYPFSDLGDVSNGAHEIVIRFNLSSTAGIKSFVGRN